MRERVLPGPRECARYIYVYLDGKHSHDYVACDAIPSALPNNQQPSRVLPPSHFYMRARARAEMPPVFNDLIKNVSSTRNSPDIGPT